MIPQFLTPRVLRLLIVVLWFTGRLFSAGLPDAPSAVNRPAQPVQPVELYSRDERMIVHNAAAKPMKPDRLIDWSFVTAHAVHAGALAFDLTLTAERKPYCAEASTNLGPDPSNRRVIAVGLAEFGGVLALDVGMRMLARRQGVPAWLGRAGGSVGAVVGTVKHIRGGMAWERSGCL